MVSEEFASTVRLGSVCSKIGSGATPRGGSQVYLEEGDCALIRSQNVYNDGFSMAGLVYIEPKHANQLNNVEVQSGDVLLNITGDSVARCCQVIDDVLPARVNQHVAIIRPDRTKLNPKYLRYYLISPRMQTKMLSWARSGGTRNALTKGMIESFDIPAPNIKEQHAIAHILDTLDDKIELNRRMNETLEQMARAIFKSWFVDFGPVRAKAEGRKPSGMNAETAKLFPDSFEDSELGKIPKRWKVKALPEMIEVNPTRSLKKGEAATYLDMKNMPTSTARAVNYWPREFKSGTKFINGDVLVARITPCLENGKTAYVDFLKDEEVGWGSTEFIVFRSKPPLPMEYTYFLARSEDFRLHAIQNMTGTSGRQRVPPDCFGSYKSVKPPKEIADTFGMLSSSTMAKIKSNDEVSRTLASIRDALLPKLLSGEIRVKDAKQVINDVA